MFENLFPILVILAIIIASILKRKKPAQKNASGSSQKPSLWKQVIGEIMDQIEEKKEAQEMRVRQHYPEAADEFLLDEDEEEPEAEPLRESIQISGPPPIQKRDRPKRPRRSIQETPPEIKREPFEFDISSYSIKELEKAIVLSEIIGPPLAFRQDQEE